MTLRDLAFVPRLRVGMARSTHFILGVSAALWFVFGALPGAAAELPPPVLRQDMVDSCVDCAATTEVGVGHTHFFLLRDMKRPIGSDDWQTANVPGPLAVQERYPVRNNGFIGGAPRLLIGDGALGGGRAVIAAALPSPASVSTPSEEPAVLPDPPQALSTATPRVLPTPTSTATRRPAGAPIVSPLPPPTPLPAITPLTILTPARCLVLALVGLGVFTIIYGLQLAIMRRLRR
jgi:hypothetical protein